MTKIVVGVCGSVAAVRVPELVRELIRQGYVIECVMTRAARKIIHSNVLEWASGKPVIKKLTGGVEHVRLLGLDGDSELLLICPATSNTISKIACGIDDTTVTTMATTAAGSKRKIIIVPAMHQSMYENPFVMENIKKLEENGIILIKPRIQEGKAKLAENKEIIERINSILKK